MKSGQSIAVLQVIDTLSMGGAETWLMELLRLWAKTGAVRMDFLATSGNPGIFDDEARQLGAQIHYVRYGRADLQRFSRAFREVLRVNRYDAIHDHQDYASGWHFLIGLGLLPPVRVTHVHSPWLHIEANYAVSLPRRLTSVVGKRLVRRFATHVCGTSAEILERYGYHPGAPGRPDISVAHCGFQVARFSGPREADRQSVLQEFGWPAESKLVLFAGRLDRALEYEHPQNHKNSWLALNVARAALTKNPALRLLMAGAGDAARDELQRHIDAWGMPDQLRLIGVRKDMPRLMRAADVLFFPSRQEGLGMVAVEAQAAGLPVLASTAVPRECVVVPELYDSLDLNQPVEVWADALLHRLAKARPLRDACARAIESSAFSVGNSARRLEHIYGSAIA
jgi:glycosyltransferase involved in cell wall biosynthesis